MTTEPKPFILTDYHKTRKVYAEMASTISAIANCRKSNNTLWLNRHSDRLQWLVDNMLPHSSGIDGDNIITADSHSEKIIIHGSYHHMDDMGCYDGWSDFVVTVTASLWNTIDVRVTGKMPRKYAGTREYLQETFDIVFRETLPESYWTDVCMRD